ncbi:MAG: hypothetical protein AAF982_08770 [Pseudomonadota bacterium]
MTVPDTITDPVAFTELIIYAAMNFLILTILIASFATSYNPRDNKLYFLFYLLLIVTFIFQHIINLILLIFTMISMFWISHMGEKTPEKGGPNTRNPPDGSNNRPDRDGPNTGNSPESAKMTLDKEKKKTLTEA